jgi:cytosine/adenosine deaminase-related metal-dependent hydrolase
VTAVAGGRVVIENCAIATMDGARHDDTGTEYRAGHIVVTDGRITAVGEGPAPASSAPASSAPASSTPAGARDGSRRIDGTGCLATPGLINTHHHLYQWLTQGRAQQSVLFDWLTELYPVWARIDSAQVHAAATAGLAWLAMSGCSTSSDHHYVFPPGAGDALEAEIAAAAAVGLRFHPCRGSMDLGRSSGGLPPDEIVEDPDEALAATAEAVRRFHDPSPGAMVRVAVAPCSPFTVSARLMREMAELARGLGVRMHTHLAETREEDAYCRQTLGRTPAEYADELGWLGRDVWLAHCVHLDEPAVKRLAVTGTSVAHCPTSNARLGSGIAPVRQLLRAGAAVGLGVDGSASSEGTTLAGELHQALLAARLRDEHGPAALSARQALWIGTRGGASCLDRADEIGALRPGMLADIALWRVDTLAHDPIAHGASADRYSAVGLSTDGVSTDGVSADGVSADGVFSDGVFSHGVSSGWPDGADPVAALVFGPPTPLELLLVGGTPVVERGELRTADMAAAAREVRAARRQLEVGR